MPEIDVDAERVGLALSNLVANALRHARTAVHVRAATEGEGVALFVEDDGPGIPEGDRERVFEPFAQVEDGRKGGGAGLGLALVRVIAALHGGRVRADASDAGGATFVLMVPSGGGVSLDPQSVRDA